MKIAIVQDELVRKGGAEQVVLSFQSAFPDAPIYTLTYNPERTYPEFKKSKIITSWFGKFVKNDKNLKRFFFPLGVYAMKGLNLKGYDVILQSTTHCAKYTKIDESALVLTYCHTPFRLVWRPTSYEEISKAAGFKRLMYQIVINILKKIDLKSAKRTDWFLTNSREVLKRIEKAYDPKNNISILHPSVKCENFYISERTKDYFLVVSRLEPYKKVDLVVEAFNNMPDKKLLIVGNGSMEKQLRGLAKSNVSFIKSLDSTGLSKAYSEAKALIFPQHEDYGITPLEANASGRPVIAYGNGGVKETMIPYLDNSLIATAVFFDEQNTDSIINAVKKFEVLDFDPLFIRNHAEKFDDHIFIENLKSFVNQKYMLSKKVSLNNA